MDTVTTFWFASSLVLNALLFVALVWQRDRNDKLRAELRTIRSAANDLVASRQVRRVIGRASQGRKTKATVR